MAERRLHSAMVALVPRVGDRMALVAARAAMGLTGPPIEANRVKAGMVSRSLAVVHKLPVALVVVAAPITELAAAVVIQVAEAAVAALSPAAEEAPTIREPTRAIPPG